MKLRTKAELEDEFETRLRAQFAYPPTEGQDRLLRFLAKFIYSEKPQCTLLIRGYAGTGKTTMTGALVKVLNDLRYKVALMAPTGRAAKVLASFSGYPAFTIHRSIYVKHDNSSKAAFRLAANRKKNTVFIVDEASMIGDSSSSEERLTGSGSLLDDLMEFVFSGENCRLILIGDGAQLPPVGTDDSPALQMKYLGSNYHLTLGEVELKEVVRQELDSGILFNANTLRLQLMQGHGGFPNLSTEGFPDVMQINGSELEECIDTLYGRYGTEGVIIITRSNKRANEFNRHIRNRILWREEAISGGDLLMVVRNNYFWLESYKDAPTPFIANGDTLQIERILGHQERYGMNFTDVEVSLRDYPDFPSIPVKIMRDVPDLDRANLGYEAQQKLYELVSEDYIDLGTRRKIHEAVMKDPFYNALQVKFAYAVTCHKSQGGQWPAVIVDQGYLTEEMIDSNLLRWFYTAFTRAQQELYLLNFHPEFFGE